MKARVPRTARRPLLALLGAVCLMLAINACASSSSANNASSPNNAGSANSDSGLAYLKGKTITYIVPDPPGNVNGLQIVAMQSALEKYLGATINIQYVPGETSIGQDKVASSAPDGLTLGVMPVKTDLSNLYAGATPLSFDMRKVSVVGSTYTGPTLVVACKGSPYKTFDDVIHGSTQAVVVNVTNGADNEKAHLLMNAFGIPHKYLNGYTGKTSSAGCQRGDGNIATQSVSGFSNSAGTALDPGLTPLLLIGAIPEQSTYKFLDSVPNLTRYADTSSGATALDSTALKILTAVGEPTAPQFVTFGPAGIPQATLTALSDAMKAVTAQPAVQKAFLAAGIPPGFVPPQTVTSYIQSQIAQQSTIEKLLKS